MLSKDQFSSTLTNLRSFFGFSFLSDNLPKPKSGEQLALYLVMFSKILAKFTLFYLCYVPVNFEYMFLLKNFAPNNLTWIFPGKIYSNFSIRIYTRKRKKYGCIWPKIIILFFWIRKISTTSQQFSGNNPFLSSLLMCESVSKENIIFCSLKPLYHKLASRKKLILPHEKYFKNSKNMVIDTVSSYDVYFFSHLQFFKVVKVTTWVKYG